MINQFMFVASSNCMTVKKVTLFLQCRLDSAVATVIVFSMFMLLTSLVWVQAPCQ